MHHPDCSSVNEEMDFDLLYHKHARTVLRYLNTHLTLKEDAEDLLIEVFLASSQNLVLFKLKSTEQQAWLLRVAHNKLADHYRLHSQQRVRVPIDDFTEMLMNDDVSQLPEPSVLRQEEHRHLRAHIETLGAPARDGYCDNDCCRHSSHSWFRTPLRHSATRFSRHKVNYCGFCGTDTHIFSPGGLPHHK